MFIRHMNIIYYKDRESPRGVVKNVLDCDIISSELLLQLR